MISKCISSDDYIKAKEIVAAYVEWLDIDLSFQDYDNEMKNFKVIYGPPYGAFYIACDNQSVLGGVGLRQYSRGVGELKRLYVRSDHKGKGIGAKLVAMTISEARHLGYKRLILDTLPEMDSAQKLYAQMGFKPTHAYRANPVVGTKYMQLAL